MLLLTTALIVAIGFGGVALYEIKGRVKTLEDAVASASNSGSDQTASLVSNLTTLASNFNTLWNLIGTTIGNAIQAALEAVGAG